VRGSKRNLNAIGIGGFCLWQIAHSFAHFD
jgi:hypothetical protein